MPLRFKANIPSEESCCIHRCSVPSDITLAAEAHHYEGIDCDIGFCDPHWTQVCEEEEAEMEPIWLAEWEQKQAARIKPKPKPASRRKVRMRRRRRR